MLDEARQRAVPRAGGRPGCELHSVLYSGSHGGLCNVKTAFSIFIPYLSTITMTTVQFSG